MSITIPMQVEHLKLPKPSEWNYPSPMTINATKSETYFLLFTFLNNICSSAWLYLNDAMPQYGIKLLFHVNPIFAGRMSKSLEGNMFLN